MEKAVPMPRGPPAGVAEQIALSLYTALWILARRAAKDGLAVKHWEEDREGVPHGIWFGAISGLGHHPDEEDLFKSISWGWYTLGKRGIYNVLWTFRVKGVTTALNISGMGHSFFDHKPMFVLLGKSITRPCIQSSKGYYTDAQFYSLAFSISLKPLCLCAFLHAAISFDPSCIHLCCYCSTIT